MQKLIIFVLGFAFGICTTFSIMNIGNTSSLSSSRASGPTATPRPTPEPLIYEGRGDAVKEFRLVNFRSVKISAQHGGNSNFVIYLKDTEGNSDLIVNEIGPYNGQNLTKTPYDGTYFLDIVADGRWIVEVQAIRR